MVEASGALMKAVTTQHREPQLQGCAKDMVEASGVLMTTVMGQHGELLVQRCA